MDQPGNNSWLPSLPNVVYTVLVTLLTGYGGFRTWRKDRKDAAMARATSTREEIERETEAVDKIAEAWESQWRACNAEVARLGRVIVEVKADRDSQIRKREIVEVENQRLERKCEHLIEQQQTLVAKVDGISRQLREMGSR